MGIVYRNINSLVLAQIFGTSVVIGYSLYGALIGIMLAPSKSLMTLPVSLLIIGPAISAIPSALLMEKTSRKFGQIVGVLIGIVGTLLSIFSLYNSNFYLFCTSTIMIGINNAFIQQYRFAIIEGISRNLSTKVISILLFGNIFSAYLGTVFIGYFKGLFGLKYIGSFTILFIFLLFSLISLCFYSSVTNLKKNNSIQDIRYHHPVNRKNLIPAMIIAALSYSVMTFIMVGTPVSMKLMHNMDVKEITFVVQAHITAMFLPSLCTGYLVSKLGNYKLVILGAFFLLMSAIVNLNGSSYNHYLISLILLGIGWNFSFICSTSILTESYDYNNRFKVQAINDLIVFGLNALSALLAGVTIFYFGWIVLNAISICFISIIFILLTYMGRLSLLKK